MRRRTYIKSPVVWKSLGFFPRVRRACVSVGNGAGRTAPSKFVTHDFAMKTAMTLQRLPGLEKSRRHEGAAFGGLALAGVSAILLALAAINRFVETRDGVFKSSLPAATGNADVTLTNATAIESKAPVKSGPGKA